MEAEPVKHVVKSHKKTPNPSPELVPELIKIESKPAPSPPVVEPPVYQKSRLSPESVASNRSSSNRGSTESPGSVKGRIYLLRSVIDKMIFMNFETHFLKS
jgi:hypothetical protein